MWPAGVDPKQIHYSKCKRSVHGYFLNGNDIFLLNIAANFTFIESEIIRCMKYSIYPKYYRVVLIRPSYTIIEKYINKHNFKNVDYSTVLSYINVFNTFLVYPKIRAIILHEIDFLDDALKIALSGSLYLKSQHKMVGLKPEFVAFRLNNLVRYYYDVGTFKKINDPKRSESFFVFNEYVKDTYTRGRSHAK